MKELSLNILDITENSIKAQATLVEILIEETEQVLTLMIKDDGCGMDYDTVNKVTDPFYTTRTTRKVGFGVPFLKLAAEQTGGGIEIQSCRQNENSAEHGTVIKAVFMKNHIDFVPLGDICSTVITLIQGSCEIDFVFDHKLPTGEVTIDTRQLRQVLGDVPLSSFEVITWIKEYLAEQYENVK
ncbi:MAG: sensor histidine kinase [bacterium]|nr:sensor histidine kinase [bacterium]